MKRQMTIRLTLALALGLFAAFLGGCSRSQDEASYMKLGRTPPPEWSNAAPPK